MKKIISIALSLSIIFSSMFGLFTTYSSASETESSYTFTQDFETNVGWYQTKYYTELDKTVDSTVTTYSGNKALQREITTDNNHPIVRIIYDASKSLTVGKNYRVYAYTTVAATSRTTFWTGSNTANTVDTTRTKTDDKYVHKAYNPAVPSTESDYSKGQIFKVGESNGFNILAGTFTAVKENIYFYNGNAAASVLDDMIVSEIIPAENITASTSDSAAGTVKVENKIAEFNTATEKKNYITAGVQYAVGETAVYTATPNAGYTFECWKDDKGNVVSTSATYEVLLDATLSKATKLTAEFAESASCPDYLQDFEDYTTVSKFGSTIITGSNNSKVIKVPAGKRFAVNPDTTFAELGYKAGDIVYASFDYRWYGAKSGTLIFRGGTAVDGTDMFYANDMSSKVALNATTAPTASDATWQNMVVELTIPADSTNVIALGIISTSVTTEFDNIRFFRKTAIEVEGEEPASAILPEVDADATKYGGAAGDKYDLANARIGDYFKFKTASTVGEVKYGNKALTPDANGVYTIVVAEGKKINLAASKTKPENWEYKTVIYNDFESDGQIYTKTDNRVSIVELEDGNKVMCYNNTETTAKGGAIAVNPSAILPSFQALGLADGDTFGISFMGQNFTPDNDPWFQVYSFLEQDKTSGSLEALGGITYTREDYRGYTHYYTYDGQTAAQSAAGIVIYFNKKSCNAYIDEVMIYPTTNVTVTGDTSYIVWAKDEFKYKSETAVYDPENARVGDWYSFTLAGITANVTYGGEVVEPDENGVYDIRIAKGKTLNIERTDYHGETGYESKAALRAEGYTDGKVNKNGLRIYNSIETSWIDSDNIVEYGSLAVKKENSSFVAAGGELDFETAKTVKIAKGVAYSEGTQYSEAKKETLWSSDSDSGLKIFTSYLTGIAPKYYGDDYLIRAYAISRSPEGEEKVFYGNVVEISVFAVANAIDNGNSFNGLPQSEIDIVAFTAFAKGEDGMYTEYDKWCKENLVSTGKLRNSQKAEDTLSGAELTKALEVDGYYEPLFERAIANEGNRALLKAMFEKAENDEEITIVGFGGSITQKAACTKVEDSYSYLVADWLRAKFPNITVNYQNAGIGATTSVLGISRITDHVLSFNPDLVIVDFTTNDQSDEYHSSSYEAILRTLLQKNIACVTIMFGHINNSEYQNSGIYHEQGNVENLHLPAMLYNDVPVIDYYGAMWDHYLDANGDKYNEEDDVAHWNVLWADYIHPSVAGHKLVANTVIHYLNKVYENLDNITETKGYPEKPLAENTENFMGAVRYDCNNISDMLTDSANVKTSNYENVDSTTTSMWTPWQISEGGYVEFTIPKARMFAIMAVYGKEYGTAKVYVNDQLVQTDDAYRNRTSPLNWQGYMCFKDSEDIKVRIECISGIYSVTSVLIANDK